MPPPFPYMPCPEKVQTIYIQENEVKAVKTFNYPGSLFDANGGAEKDVNNRVKIALSKWMETTGVMCDKNVPIKLKDKVDKTAIKPAIVYGQGSQKLYNWPTILSPPHYRNGVHHTVEIICLYCGELRDVSENI